MKLNKYFYENYPLDMPFDSNNPRYVLSLDGVDAILEKIIINKPYSLEIADLDKVELVKALLHIEALQLKNGKLGMAVPFFTASDEAVLKELSKKAAKNIGNELLKQKVLLYQIAEKLDNGHSAERNLYHLLCGDIFDGLMFDYLEENHLVTTSRVHKSGLDYLVILYEDTDSLNEYSDLLLCSFNRLTVKGKGFVSFGDSNGNRKDFYRYMRLRELGRLSEQESVWLNDPAEELVEQFNKMLNGDKIDSKYLEIFEYFDYCRNGKIAIPVYDSSASRIVQELYEFVLEITKEQIASALTVIQGDTRLLAVSHKVDVKDIANEIYHLIFGEVNELLVREGIVATPPYVQGEGRYFKAFER